MTWMPGSTAWTTTGTLTGGAPGIASTFERSTVAVKLEVVIRGRSVPTAR